MTDKVPFIELNNGKKIPQLGLGTWLSKPGEVSQAVKDAIDAGYRHLDCAYAYENENEVGEALKAKFDEGVVKRDDLFITSKLSNNFHPQEMVVPALKKSLKALGLEYVDMYLIHWPTAFQVGDKIVPRDQDGNIIFSDDIDYVETWKGMEEAVSLGLTRSIGMSNFNSEQLDRILTSCKIKPVMLQVECHPYFNQKKLIDFCKSKGVSFTAYSPLGAPARPWATAQDEKLLDHKNLKELATKLNKSTAQIAIRYQIQRGVVVIPKSVTKSRIKENFNVFDFNLSEEDMETIDNMHCNHRFLSCPWLKPSKYFPFGIEF